ncbi:MAG: 3-oxoacyl-ACP synthase [Deltaproteobacteria bacterium]|nr:3-oxoacyl-ACP synthase [Deltaproteobacteria bacterium]
MTASVFPVGSGTYLPGDPIPVEKAQEVLGELTEAPRKIRRWMASMDTVMREILDITYVHYAIDPITREFTDDNVTMGTAAARAALEMAAMDPSEIDLICYGSAHQDQMPTASVRIQEALGIESCAEFSIHANCTSAYKAIYLAHQLLATGRYRNALVISSGISSSELRAEYYNQQLVDKESLFLRWFLSDGAGALVLTTDPARSRGLELETTYVESVGGKRPSLMFNNRPALYLNPVEEYEKGLHHLRQHFRNELATGIFQEEGGSVFLNGFKRMLDQGGIDPSTIRIFQINLPAKHIVEAVAEECLELGIPGDRIFTQMDSLGYTGPPMVLICLDSIMRESRLSAGDRVVSFVTEVSKFMQAGYSIRAVNSQSSMTHDPA